MNNFQNILGSITDAKAFFDNCYCIDEPTDTLTSIILTKQIELLIYNGVTESIFLLALHGLTTIAGYTIKPSFLDDVREVYMSYNSIEAVSNEDDFSDFGLERSYTDVIHNTAPNDIKALYELTV